MNGICMKTNTYINFGKCVYKIIYSRICFPRYTYFFDAKYIFHPDNIYTSSERYIYFKMNRKNHYPLCI